jgi:hypothetical protein
METAIVGGFHRRIQVYLAPEVDRNGSTAVAGRTNEGTIDLRGGGRVTAAIGAPASFVFSPADQPAAAFVRDSAATGPRRNEV